MPVAVKIIRRRVWCRVWRKVSLESHSCNVSGGKGGSYPARTNLKNAASEPDKQIVRAVNSQTTSHIRDNGASQPGRSKFIDSSGNSHKQVACPVKSQTLRFKQSGGESGSHSVWSKFIDTAGAGTTVDLAELRRKQVACAVKGQTSWIR